MYHLANNGPSEIHLKNGYRLAKTPYGEGVSIYDLDGLLDAVDAAIAGDASPKRLVASKRNDGWKVEVEALHG